MPQQRKLWKTASMPLLKHPLRNTGTRSKRQSRKRPRLCSIGSTHWPTILWVRPRRRNAKASLYLIWGKMFETLDDFIEKACEVMHDAYEKAAVGAGWETQQSSRKPWSDVPEA